MTYKPMVKKFLNKNVRCIETTENNHYQCWVVCKDLFDALGRLTSDNQIETTDRNKLERFLNDIDKLCDRETFTITSKSKKAKSRDTQEVDCLKIETVPIVLTQFRPTSRKGEEALKCWQEFMKWVANLLEEAEAWKVIFTDKEEQKQISEIITNETDEKMVVINTQICYLMGELIAGEKIKLNKEQLKMYQPKTTIDLIEVRQEAFKIYQQNLIMFESKTIAYEGTLKYMKKKYKINN